MAFNMNPKPLSTASAPSLVAQSPVPYVAQSTAAALISAPVSTYPKQITKSITFEAFDLSDEIYLSAGSEDFISDLKAFATDVNVNILEVDGKKL